jgi:drug/metabolite transporter (DMT)-like permease
MHGTYTSADFVFWILPALAAPILWAASNLIDERLVRKSVRDPMALLLITGLFGSLPVILVFLSGLPDPTTLLLALLGGCLEILAYYPYLVTLKTTSASNVILMWNLAPVFIMLLAHAFLGERLFPLEYLALFFLVVSSMLASFNSGKKPWNKKAFLWMLVASLLLAFSSVIEKAVYERVDFMMGFGWLSFGVLLTTVYLFFVFSKARHHLFSSFKSSVSSLLVGNEVLDLSAVALQQWAISLGPVSLVYGIDGTQPIFILLIGWLFLRRRPKLEKAELVRTIIAVALAVVGLVIIGNR